MRYVRSKHSRNTDETLNTANLFLAAGAAAAAAAGAVAAGAPAAGAAAAAAATLAAGAVLLPAPEPPSGTVMLITFV